jgi:hypothetical protein
LIAALAGAAGAAMAQDSLEGLEGERVPSFAELEAAGARIGEIRVVPQDIFDLTDPAENNWLFRLANKLHIQTRPEVIRRLLLFKTGDPVSVQAIEETERLLRAKHYLYEVSIQPISHRDGVADIEVKTRDTWSLDLGIGLSREGGENKGRVAIKEDNLLGTGITLGIGYTSDVDRRGTEFNISDTNLFGTYGVAAYSYADYDDGSSQSFTLQRPFYALDARWAAGISAAENDQVTSQYNAGDVIAEYRVRSKTSEAFGGWSPGLIAGWTTRYSAGVFHNDSDYELEPDKPPPVRLPSDLTLAGPFLRFELIEDAFRTDVNLNLIGRVEDFAMGVQTRLQVGRALTEWGSTRDSWLYSLSLSNVRYHAGGAFDAPRPGDMPRRARTRPSEPWCAITIAAGDGSCTTRRFRRTRWITRTCPVRSRSAATTACAAIRCATRRANGGFSSRPKRAATPTGIRFACSASAARCSTTWDARGKARTRIR